MAMANFVPWSDSAKSDILHISQAILSSLLSHLGFNRPRSFRHLLGKVDTETKLTEHHTDYLKINPKGYVPALALSSGVILTEGPAILQFLADKFSNKLEIINFNLYVFESPNLQIEDPNILGS